MHPAAHSVRARARTHLCSQSLVERTFLRVLIAVVLIFTHIVVRYAAACVFQSDDKCVLRVEQSGR